MASKIENPLSMRFVLPEQRALYLQMKEDDKLVTMPKLEQDELGSTCEMWGVVKWIDQNGGRIKQVNEEDIQWISMDNITEVKG